MVIHLTSKDYRKMIDQLQIDLANQEVERKRLEERIARQLEERDRLQQECKELEEVLEIYEEIANKMVNKRKRN